MNYKLNFNRGSYTVQDLQFPSETILADAPAGHPFSFVSPVPLTIGQCCHLLGESVGYQLLVNRCAGFTYSLRYFISGTIVTKESAAVVRS